MMQPGFANIQEWLTKYDSISNVSISKKMFGEGEFMVSWFVNNLCNFSCDYCGHYKKEHESVGKIPLHQIAKSFDIFGKTGHIIITGGEPFLFPGFTELCRLITKKHYLSLNTNLSLPETRIFAENISPDRVLMINAGLHLKFRSKLKNGMDDFISNYKYFLEKGFSIFASYVIYPNLILQFEKDIATYESMGIRNISAKSFSGIFNGKTYPAAYTESERKRIEKYMKAQIDMPEYLVNTCFKNRPCFAGKDFFSIDPGGNACRCNSDATSFGNIFTGSFSQNNKAVPCRMDECLCPYQGMIYSSAKKGIIKRIFHD